MRFYFRFIMLFTIALLSFNSSAIASGDCDGSGTVTISEVQSTINMFLGLKPPVPCADEDLSGSVSISEVQKVINTFLGITSANEVLTIGNYSRRGPVHNYAVGSTYNLTNPGKVYLYENEIQVSRTEDICQFRRNSDGSLSEMVGTTEKTRYDWEDLTAPVTPTALFLIASDKVTGRPLSPSKWAIVYPHSLNAGVPLVLSSDGRLCIGSFWRWGKDSERFIGITSVLSEVSLKERVGSYTGSNINGDLSGLGLDPLNPPEIKLQITNDGGLVKVSIGTGYSERVFQFDLIDNRRYSPPLNLANLNERPLVEFPGNKFFLFNHNPFFMPGKDCIYLEVDPHTDRYKMHYGCKNYDLIPGKIEEDGFIEFSVSPLLPASATLPKSGLTFSKPLQDGTFAKEMSLPLGGLRTNFSSDPIVGYTGVSDTVDTIFLAMDNFGIETSGRASLRLDIEYEVNNVTKSEDLQGFSIYDQTTNVSSSNSLHMEFWDESRAKATNLHLPPLSPKVYSSCHISGPNRAHQERMLLPAYQAFQMENARKAGATTDYLAQLAQLNAEILVSPVNTDNDPPTCTSLGITLNSASGTLRFSSTPLAAYPGDYYNYTVDPTTFNSVTGTLNFTAPLTVAALQHAADVLAAKNIAEALAAKLAADLLAAQQAADALAAQQAAEAQQAADDLAAEARATKQAAQQAEAVTLAAIQAADVLASQQAAKGGGPGTAAQYFTKNAVNNQWIYQSTCTGPTCPSNSSILASTITASKNGVVTLDRGLFTTTMKIDAAGALISTNNSTPDLSMATGLYTDPVIELPGTFSVGTSWLRSSAFQASFILSYPAVNATIAAFNVTRTVPAGTFSDCLQVNWTDTMTSAIGTSNEVGTLYYSPTVGAIVESTETGVANYTGIPAMTMVRINKLQAGYIALP